MQPVLPPSSVVLPVQPPQAPLCDTQPPPSHMTETSQTTSPPVPQHSQTQQPAPSDTSHSQSALNHPTQPPIIEPNQHTMTTRARNNIHKPIQKLNLSTQLSHHDSLEPTTAAQALKCPKWRQAMSEEYDAIVRNGTWELVPHGSHQNVIGCKWIFRTKHNFDGSIDRF
ncbi:hypothetical protein EZV62_008524 [Acer yangbiense]|uniref:Reverse transcriptase Ty1/copia-type domain-containing protein n=1 Tax=Acer yangbiense TaxID=1000413 RepID=A0A5C7IE74_9ROSI|nr:hypothetical protein EZV62_008524 [Acer yangbiense]